MTETKKQKYFFKDGEEVCHIENTSQKMFIERILFHIYDKSKIDKPNEKEPIKKIIGIKCHWWEGSSFKTGDFHKSELIPYEIALGSTYTDNQRWIAENNS